MINKRPSIPAHTCHMYYTTYLNTRTCTWGDNMVVRLSERFPYPSQRHCEQVRVQDKSDMTAY